jgi:ABC-2 type transport system permease protein
MNGKLIQMELRLFFRDPASIIVTLALSPVILVILGSIPSFREPGEDLGGLRVIDVYVPIMITMAMAMIGVNALPTMLVTYRERGILRRLSTTPARPKDMLIAQMITHLTLVVGSVVLIMMLGRILYGVALPANPFAFLLAFALAAGALFGFGLLLAASVRTSKVAAGVGSLAFFPMLFFAGLWVPREVMPAGLRNVSDFTPLGAGVQAMSDAAAGHWPQPLHLAVMATYALLAWLAAVKLFRWQ